MDKKKLQYLGKRIKDLRLSKELKLETLAYRVGISPSTIFRIESGTSEPKYLTLLKIADAFKMPISELLCIDDKDFSK